VLRVLELQFHIDGRAVAQEVQDDRVADLPAIDGIVQVDPLTGAELDRAVVGDVKLIDASRTSRARSLPSPLKRAPPW